MLLQKMCIFIAKVVYLDAISMTKYELFFKLLYVYKCYIITLSNSVETIILGYFLFRSDDSKIIHLIGILCEYSKVGVNKDVGIPINVVTWS